MQIRQFDGWPTAMRWVISIREIGKSTSERWGAEKKSRYLYPLDRLR